MEQPRNDNQGIVLPSTFIYLLRILEFMHPYLGMRLAAFSLLDLSGINYQKERSL